MKILFSTYTTAFQNPGGGENIVRRLASSLVERGHSVELFDPLKTEVSGFDIIHHFSLVETGVWDYLKRIAPRAVLAVTPTIFMKKSLKQYLKWKVHLVGACAERVALSMPLRHYSLVDLWLPSTSHESEVLANYYGFSRKKIKILPNGVDASFQKADPSFFRNQSMIAGPFILHVGRFHPVKNQKNLIRAANALGAQVVFIGGASADDAAYRNSCIALARELESRDNQGLTRFHFFDHQPFGSDFLRSAYAAATLFALPSEFESFGISALEALMAGAPLVLTKNVADQALFPTAKFIEPSNLSELTLAIKNALANPVRPSTESREELLKKYSWPKITDTLIGLYQGAREKSA